MKFILEILILVITLQISNAYRILAICPTPAKSHQIIFHSIVSALLNQGHELVVMTADPINTSNSNLTQIDWSSSYKSRFSNTNWIKIRGLNVIALGLNDMPHIIDTSLSHPEVKDLILRYRNESFDAVLVEYLGYTPIYAFAELFNTTMIGFTSLQIDASQHEALGNGVHPIIFSANLMGYYTVNNIYRRVWNVLTYLVGGVLYEMFNFKFDKIIDKHFGEKVYSRSVELARRVDLVLLDANPFLGFVRPMVPNAVPVSFLHVYPPKPLPMEIKNFLDESHDGAIYFSFGTCVKTRHMDLTVMNNFKKVFDGLPYNVLWKRDPFHQSNLTSKYLISSWFPQQDILAHKNIKVFITQGGLPSLEEAVHRGVPIVVVPFLYDQFDNAEIIEEKGIGVYLDRDKLTVANIRKAILEVIENPNYKQNMMDFSRVVKDEIIAPREKAVWWIEYAIRNRDMMKHLKYKGVTLPFYQRYMIDVVCIFIIFLYLLFHVVRWFCNWIKSHHCFLIKVQVKLKAE